MIRRLVGRWWSTPRVRRRVAGIVVAVGFALMAIAILSGRWGWLVAGIVLVGVGASLGPARIRRRSDRMDG